MLLLIFVAFGAQAASAQWGAPASDVRAGLSFTADRTAVELSLENRGRDRYLLLGTIGTGHPDRVRFTLTTPGSPEQNLILRVKPAAVAPSVQSPLVVPLLAGSRYVYRARVALYFPRRSNPARLFAPISRCRPLPRAR